MDLYKRFNGALYGWVAYCKQPSVQVSSDPSCVTACPSFQEICHLGSPALPLIRELYDKKEEDEKINCALEIIKSFGLVAVVQRIAGPRFMIPENLSGKVEEIEQFTKYWLDENMEYYVSPR